MTTVAWWNCFAGIAGDMALASLVDAGADLGQVVSGLERLPLRGWSLEAHRVERAGLMGTHLQVEVGEEDVADARNWSAIDDLLASAEGLPARAVRRARDVFAALAAAEGRLHGTPAEEVHFHEVGGTDAIIDVVGTCLALEFLEVGSVHASPVTVGLGTVGAAHGLLPNPAPAVMELLAGAPLRGTDRDVELTTPTGAALLAALAQSFGPVPPMKVVRTGYGAGTRDLPGMPNMVQVVLGEMARAGDEHLPVPGSPGPATSLAGETLAGETLAGAALQDLVVLEANLDDVTGEVMAHTVRATLAAGALDAWIVPIVGKKGRPAHVLTVLSAPSTAPSLAELVARQTGVLGLRSHRVSRWALPRKVVQVEVSGRPVRVKVGPYRGKAEHEDCVVAAGHLGLTVAEVARRAEQAAAEAGATVA